MPPQKFLKEENIAVRYLGCKAGTKSRQKNEKSTGRKGQVSWVRVWRLAKRIKRIQLECEQQN